MAITKATMQMRRGNEADFDASKLLSGEWAISEDEGRARMGIGSGKAIEMMTVEAFDREVEPLFEEMKGYADSASQSASNAKTSEDNAKLSENHAKQSEINAKASELKAKEYRDQAFSGTPQGYEALVNKVDGISLKTATAKTHSLATQNGGIRLNRVGGNTVKDDTTIHTTAEHGSLDIVEIGGVKDSGVYGVEVDMVNKTFTRLANSVGKSAGADFDNVQAFNRRRCNVLDNGSVVAYYGDSNYKEDGSNGQVMLEQNRFFYKVEPIAIEPISGGKGYHLRKARYYISDVPRDGFKIHPLFVRNGKIVDKVYLSAYEGSTYDVSANAYNKTDAQTVDWANDKLSSIANAKPTSGVSQSGATRNGFRTIASNRGSDWSQATVQAATATEILFLVEYASFDMQTNIGIGVTNKTWQGTNDSEITGATTSLGNKTGRVSNTNGFIVVSYRGEENPFGNIWKWIDGINVYNYDEGSVHIADHGFKDDTKDAPYQDAGITICDSNGYVSAFAYNEDFDWLFIASECSENDKLPVSDYFHQSKAEKRYSVAKLGGSWDGGSLAGGFDWIVSNASSIRVASIGGRLLYVPTEHEPKNTKQITIPLTSPLYKVGDVQDYLDEDGEHHFIGSVDLGSLEWIKHTNASYGDAYLFVTTISNMRSGASYGGTNKAYNAICSEYNSIGVCRNVGDSLDAFNNGNDKEWCVDGTKNQILMIDKSYTDTSSFKTAMSGVMLYYELATPTVTPLTTDQKKAMHSLVAFDEQTYIDTTDVEGAKADLSVTYSASDVGSLALQNENQVALNNIRMDEITSAMLALSAN